jgi:uncharacterized membrane protein YeaQ/YmgE (transglycosylase-associated protein family)
VKPRTNLSQHSRFAPRSAVRGHTKRYAEEQSKGNYLNSHRRTHRGPHRAGVHATQGRDGLDSHHPAGVVGSFVGGFLSQMMLGRNDDMVKGSPFEPSGIIGTVIGALIVLGIYHLVRRRSALPTVGR